MGYRVCISNGSETDVFMEPKGWDMCPCEVPKCRTRAKCEKESIMCRAFEIWSTNGSRLLPTGTHMMGFEDCLYPKGERRPTVYKGGVIKKPFEVEFIRKIESMWADGKRSRQIAEEFNSSCGYIENLIRRFRKDPNFLFKSRNKGVTHAGRLSDNKVSKEDARNGGGEVQREVSEETGLVSETQVHEGTGDELQGVVSGGNEERPEATKVEGYHRSRLVYP